MYLSGIKASAQWADELLKRHAPPGWRCVFFLPKTAGLKRTGHYGHADVSRRVIELAASTTEQTTGATWVVLHEIAHAIHDYRYRKSGGYYNKIKRKLGKRRRPRNSIHPPAFWRIALSLYRQYPGIVEHALAHEYMVGRKYIRHAMEKKAAA